MNRGTRLTIVAGLIIAIATVATIMAVTAPESQPTPPADNGGNTTNGGPRQFNVEIDETLNVGVE